MPHLLETPFYVYGYAFGECLTSSLYQVYQSGNVPDFANKYKEMLSKGASERPAELLKPFGLDISKPDFWKQGLGMIKGHVDRLETLTDQLGMDKTAKKSAVSVIRQAKSAAR
ncbi:MAG: M3 family metallopeptidase [Alphaproteobacteria bacterium]